MARSKVTRAASRPGPATAPEVRWTRAARVRIGIEPQPGETRKVPVAELTADLSELGRSWTEYSRSESRFGRWDPWRELRRRIARADAKTEAEARAAAGKLRASAPLSLRCVLAFLFPGEPGWSRADAEACLARTGAAAVPSCAEILLGALDDPGLSRRIVEARVRSDEYRDFSFQAIEIVHGLGARAVPVIEALFDILEEDRCADTTPRSNAGAEHVRAYCAEERKLRSKVRFPRVLEAMELIRTPEAASFFAAHLGIRR